MREVTKEEFFKAIGNLDVHPYHEPGPWPYTSIWKMRNGRQIVGKSIAHRIDANGNRYFLPEKETNKEGE